MGINKQELIGKIHGIEGLGNEEKSALIELLKTHKKYAVRLKTPDGIFFISSVHRQDPYIP